MPAHRSTRRSGHDRGAGTPFSRGDRDLGADHDLSGDRSVLRRLYRGPLPLLRDAGRDLALPGLGSVPLVVLYVAVDHGVIGTLFPHATYNNPDAVAHPWHWALIHAAFVLGEAVALLAGWKVIEAAELQKVGLDRSLRHMLFRIRGEVTDSASKLSVAAEQLASATVEQTTAAT